jgi:hypothetical protein
MSERPRYSTKPDRNQEEIVRDLRARGFDVDIICDIPGLYDLVVSKQVSVRVEVKSERGELTESEKEYYQKQKHKGSYIIARSAADVVHWFNSGRSMGSSSA